MKTLIISFRADDSAFRRGIRRVNFQLFKLRLSLWLRRIAAIIGLTLASIGCFAQGAPKNVKIVVYRAKQFTARFKALQFYCDEHVAADLNNGRYFVLSLAPGLHTFRGADKGTSIQLDIRAGEKYFIRAEQAVGTWKGTQQITSVDPSLAHSEMYGLKPIDKEKIWDYEHVSQQ